MDILSTLEYHGQPVVAVEHRPIRPDFQRARLAGCKRRLLLAARQAPEEFELDSIEGALTVQELEFRSRTGLFHAL